MFGNNPIRSVTSDPGNLAVEEMFYTIQGEGPQAGEPCVFIRLAGCNLACHFCDTQFETQAENLQPIGSILNSLLESFTRKQRRLIILTGGEPLRQDPTTLLIQLLNLGTELIQIETAGTVWPKNAELDRLVATGKVQLVCSPKTPKIHEFVIGNCDHYKYVITAGETDPDDGLPNRGTQVATKDKLQKLYRASSSDTIWLSPCDAYDNERNYNNMVEARDLCLKHGYRLSLQVHKIINVR
jgi:7-carboxy-7-deazaguanine synthase